MSKSKKAPEINLCDFYPFNLAADLIVDIERIYTPGIQAALETLTERERAVIACRYRDRLTLEETARLYNITRERIRQIEAKALRKLRHPQRAALYKAVPVNEYKALQGEHDKLLRGYERLKEAYALMSGKSTEPPEINKVLLGKTKIEELYFSVRAYNCLRRAGKNTLKDIADMTAEDLIKVRNLGRKSAQEVVSKLAEYGMSLSGDKTMEEVVEGIRK